MINKKRLLLIALILCALCSISSVAANDNMTCENQAIDNESSDDLLKSSDLKTDEDILTCENDSQNILNSTDEDTITISEEETVLSQDSNENKLSASYADVYLDSITTHYNSGKYFYFGWWDYFDGYFEVYKGSSLYYSEYLYGYDQDFEWSLEGMTPGTYTAKLITYNGITLGSAKIVIKKSSSKISVKSFKATAGSKFYCYAYVKDKYTGRNYDGGTVKFKINGKTYKAKLIDGVAVAKIKIPSKVKKFTCTATFSGGKNVYSSKTKFKITVKKKPKYKTISIKTKMSTSKYVTKYYGKYKIQTLKFKHSMTTLCVFLYKNGKMLYKNKYATKIHYKEYGKWKWSEWLYGNDAATYHKYFCSNDVKIGSVKVKFKV